MIIVNIKGGLGNQMFQYALYLVLKHSGKDVKICTEYFDWARTEKRNLTPQHGKKFLIEHIFGTRAVHATLREVKQLSTVRMDIISRIRRKLNLKKKTHLSETQMGYPPLEKLLSLDGVFLDGYWQRFDYLEPVRDLIRREYAFSIPLTGRNLLLAGKLKEENAVSVHIRRNDYLKIPAYVVQNEQYYQKSMQFVAQKIHNPIFYCFSDDTAWCREHLSNPNYKLVFVDWNSGEESYRDMQLMGLCKANIIANSTFSMWAAWLNMHKDNLVIRPEHYYTDPQTDQGLYWPKQWIKM